MGREVKRVSLDFDWPLNTIWVGYMWPDRKIYAPNLTEDQWEKLTNKYYKFVHIDPPEGEGYQLWETVSEGSPISPVFPDEQSFKNYLIGKGYSEKAVDNFIKEGWAPSGIFNSRGYKANIEACSEFKNDKT